jgi:hypothetical protein
MGTVSALVALKVLQFFPDNTANCLEIECASLLFLEEDMHGPDTLGDRRPIREGGFGSVVLNAYNAGHVTKCNVTADKCYTMLQRSVRYVK